MKKALVPARKLKHMLSTMYADEMVEVCFFEGGVVILPEDKDIAKIVGAIRAPFVEPLTTEEGACL